MFYGSFTIYNRQNRPVFEIVSSDSEMSNRWFLVDANRTVLYGIHIGQDSNNRPVMRLIHNEKLVGLVRPGKGKLEGFYTLKTPKATYIFRGNPFKGDFKLISPLGVAMESKYLPGSMDQFAIKITTPRQPMLLLATAIGLTGFRIPKRTARASTRMGRF